jgi:hypothetical protein
MSVSGHIILEYQKKTGAILENAAAGFEFPAASETESGFIRVNYLTNENFLFDDANGYFLSGEPTSKMSALIENLESINKSNWGHAISDETILDSKDVRTGFTRVFNTDYDVSGETNNLVRAGVGAGDDLLMIRILNFDPQEAIGPGLFTISGDILAGNFREQQIEHENLYNFAPEVQNGYLYVNSGELFLYGSKVTEVFPDYDATSGMSLSGTPNDWAPLMIRVGDLEPLVLGCTSGAVEDYKYFESDQYHNHYLDEWNGNFSPASPFHRVEGLARVYVGETELEDRAVSTTPITVDHYINSGIINAVTSGELIVTYEELDQDKCVLPDADLSPLTWEDGDRILAMQPFERPPYSVSTYGSQHVIQPVITTDIISGDANLVNIIANVRDEDGAPVSGVLVGFDLSMELMDISGNTITADQTLEEYITTPPSGLAIRSIEHLFTMDTSYSGDVFDAFDVGLFTSEPGNLIYAMPARSYIEDDGSLVLVRYLETDQFGSASCPIRIHNFNDYTSENKIRVAVSGYPLVTNDLNFRILAVGDPIDGYVEVPATGYSVPDTLRQYQYLSPSGSAWAELDGYPYGGENMVKLYEAGAFSEAWHLTGASVDGNPVVHDTAAELWYDGTGVAHARFDSIPISGGYIGWNKMLSHTTDFVGTNYVE